MRIVVVVVVIVIVIVGGPGPGVRHGGAHDALKYRRCEIERER